MIASRDEEKEEQYNYLLKWVAELLWLLKPIDLNRAIATTHMTILTDKKGIIIERFSFFILKTKTRLVQRSSLSIKIPIAQYQVHHYVVAPAVSSM